MAKAVEMNNKDGFKEGDPYRCPQCKRTHTKGKIYKEHLNLFLNDEPDKEEIDNIELDDEDEKELREVFDDDFEPSFDDSEPPFDGYIDDGMIIEEEDDGLLDFDDNGKYKEEVKEAIAAVKSIPGVGDATLKKLISAGYGSLESIAYTPPSVIQEDSGLGDKTIIKIVKAAMDKLNMGFKSADIIWEKRKNIARITTGSEELDELLGGGIETGSLIEFFGEFRTGKTQIMHQLCVNVQLPKEKGGIEGRALYIDTEGTFRPERIIQMSEALDLDYEKVLKNIVYGRAYTSDHQILMIKEAGNVIKEKNIKLIIVDSLIGHFRSEYVGRGTLAGRQQTINQHLHDLLRLCDIYPDLAVLVTNQVQSKPDCFYGNPIQAAGGNIIAHGSTIRVFLRKGKGEQRIAKIVDAPNLPEGEAIFSITEGGIREA